MPESSEYAAGKRYGRLQILESFTKGEKHKQKRFVRCKCDCGKVVDKAFRHVKAGVSLSCGCLRSELNADRQRKHDGFGTPLYHVWGSMKQRCLNPKTKNWNRYGGRGITVCKEWSESFEAFRDWANANGYQAVLELDRTNNDGNYEPGNCRWVTRSRNMRNQSLNRIIEAFGESKTLKDWSEDPRCSVKWNILQARLNRGMEVHRAITEPTISPDRKIEAFGEIRSFTGWSKDPRCKVSAKVLWARIETYGWDIEKAITTPPRKNQDEPNPCFSSSPTPAVVGGQTTTSRLA